MRYQSRRAESGGGSWPIYFAISINDEFYEVQKRQRTYIEAKILNNVRLVLYARVDIVLKRIPAQALMHLSGKQI